MLEKMRELISTLSEREGKKEATDALIRTGVLNADGSVKEQIVTHF